MRFCNTYRKQNMIKISDIKIDRQDINKCYYEVDLVEIVMEHPCSLFFLEKRNNGVVDEIISSKPHPKCITQLKIKIIPTEENKTHYSFSGIETIIYNLFNNVNENKIREDLENGDTFFKVYYTKDEMYNIPILMLEFIFFRKLLPETIEFLSSKLKIEGFFYTGNIGKIEVEDFIIIDDLKKVLSIPLLVGQPEFKRKGVLRTYKFSIEQLKEMNYIHGISVIELKMGDIINNQTLSIFDTIRELIKKSNSEKDFEDYSEDDIEKIVQNIFNGVPNDDELPF